MFKIKLTLKNRKIKLRKFIFRLHNWKYIVIAIKIYIMENHQVIVVACIILEKELLGDDDTSKWCIINF